MSRPISKDIYWESLFRAMIENNISTTWIGEKCDMTAMNIYYYLVGQRRPSQETINEIAKALNVSPDYIKYPAKVRMKRYSKRKTSESNL